MFLPTPSTIDVHPVSDGDGKDEENERQHPFEPGKDGRAGGDDKAGSAVDGKDGRDQAGVDQRPDEEQTDLRRYGNDQPEAL